MGVEMQDKELPLDQSSLYKNIANYNSLNISPIFCRKNGLLFQYDSIEWLKQLPSSFVDMIFADPPYNIKKADWDTFESEEKYFQEVYSSNRIILFQRRVRCRQAQVCLFLPKVYRPSECQSYFQGALGNIR